MTLFKIYLLKFLYNVIRIGDNQAQWPDRMESFISSAALVAPLTIGSTVMARWYFNNREFSLAVVVLIFINMILGAWMHWKKGDFKLVILQNKTVAMVIGVGMVYLVMEMVISHGGNNIVTQGFRNALQVTSLLYPASKILKNIFIITKGEYPPKWIMHKIFNFQENGDLNGFMNNNFNDTPDEFNQKF
jgi:hypothetical protein